LLCLSHCTPMAAGLDEDGQRDSCMPCSCISFAASKEGGLPELHPERWGANGNTDEWKIPLYYEGQGCCWGDHKQEQSCHQCRQKKENHASSQNGICITCGNTTCSKNNSNECKLLRCARCKNMWYCSKACQRNDWKRHKRVCSLDNASATVDGNRSWWNWIEQVMQFSTMHHALIWIRTVETKLEIPALGFFLPALWFFKLKHITIILFPAHCRCEVRLRVPTEIQCVRHGTQAKRD